jgi:hypothetical protein
MLLTLVAPWLGAALSKPIHIRSHQGHHLRRSSQAQRPITNKLFLLAPQHEVGSQPGTNHWVKVLGFERGFFWPLRQDAAEVAYGIAISFHRGLLSRTPFALVVCLPLGLVSTQVSKVFTCMAVGRAKGTFIRFWCPVCALLYIQTTGQRMKLCALSEPRHHVPVLLSHTIGFCVAVSCASWL